jgi:hypothetical protein
MTPALPCELSVRVPELEKREHEQSVGESQLPHQILEKLKGGTYLRKDFTKVFYTPYLGRFGTLPREGVLQTRSLGPVSSKGHSQEVSHDLTQGKRIDISSFSCSVYTVMPGAHLGNQGILGF